MTARTDAVRAWLRRAILVPLRLLLLVVVALGAAGCEPPFGSEHEPGALAPWLAGTDDVELTYEVTVDAEQAAAFGRDLRALILGRLGAARIGADVDADGRRVKIVVDEALGPLVDELVTWTGTLLVLDPDPALELAPRERSSGLTRRTDGGESWYEGSRADVLRAIETWPIDHEHRVLAEPIWSSGGRATARQPVRWRTRVVKATPVGEIGDGALVGWGDGPTLRVRGVRGSLTESVIQDARARRAPPIVARGRVSLGTPGYDDTALGTPALTIGFGEGAEAYARAQRERHLLTTARLPPMRRLGALGLPPNRSLAAACLVVPIVLSLAWLAFVRRFDRAHPEPMWLVGLTFLFGCLATIPAGLVELSLASVSTWLDPSLVTFGGQWFALPLAIVVYTVVVGLSEEGSKRLAAQLAVRRPEFDEPVDGIVYGIVASLGFAAAENVRYFALGRMTAPLVIARCFMSVPAHMFFGAIWGYALGKRLVAPRTRAWPWLLAAAALHGLFDALLSTEGAGLLAVLLNVALASAFVVLVRDGLRHGVVTKDMLAIRREDRALFRVGRPALFWASAAALHALALGIFLLGAYYQLARHRPSLGFVAGSSVMLALLAVAALGVSATMPLDVAIDEHGVTFAGAARAWRKIRGYRVRSDRVELDCEAGPLLLGPAPHAVVRAIAAELETRLGDGGTGRVHTLESRASSM